MTINPTTGLFTRVWKFVDHRQAGDNVTRSDLDVALDDLAGGINSALHHALNFIGEWDANTAFPTLRPDGRVIQIHDAWAVSAAGTADGVAFVVGDYLVALVAAPGSTYASNWLRVPSSDVSAIAAADSANEAAASAAILDTLALGRRYTITLVEGTTLYDLAFDPGLHTMNLEIEASAQHEGVDYTIVEKLDSPSGVGIQFVAAKIEGLGGLTAYYWAPLALPFDPNTQNVKSFETRVLLKAHIDLYGATAGYTFFAGGKQYRTIPVDDALYGTNPISDLPGLMPQGTAEPLHWGVDITGVTDATAEVHAWLDYCEGKEGFWSPGIYRIEGALTLPSRCNISGVMTTEDDRAKGTVVQQYGTTLFQGSDLTGTNIDCLMIEMKKTSPNGWDCALRLGAHQYCNLTNFYFYGYENASIIDRIVGADDTLNTTFNRYHLISRACLSFAFTVGREALQYTHQGDGTTTVINTDLAWPYTNVGSVVVLKEDINRVLTDLVPVTDFTVSFSAGKLIVTTAVAATTTERLWIWPAQPNSAGRLPVSGNTWDRSQARYCYSRGYQSLRWVDSEMFNSCTFMAAVDDVKLFVTNPYRERTGQGGDYMALNDCNFTYNSAAVTDVTTLVGMDLGPGSVSTSARNVRADGTWLVGTTNYIRSYLDMARVAMTGTVSTTNGSPIITGVGTNFLSAFTLASGSNTDVTEIAGTVKGILSIDSDTQITCSANWGVTQSGKTLYRINRNNATDAEITYGSTGDVGSNTKFYKMADEVINSSSRRSGSAVVPSGNTTVVVTHGLRRAPITGEVTLTPYGAVTPYLDAVGATTFTITLPSAAAADTTIGWSADLRLLN